MFDFIKGVEKHRELVLKAERDLWKIPEEGYREFKTNAYMINAFEDLGYVLTLADGITGFYTTIDTGREGPTVLLLAELDALFCSSHPECDSETGIVHACGHHAQMASILGVAGALKEEGALEGLCGKIKLCLVPAEEGVNLSFRKGLIEKGVISYTSGKPEFISRGYFNDVDISFMVHTSRKFEDKIFTIDKGSNGVLRKKTTVKGVAAHAGSNPQDGVNALNVASTIITSINSLRETFWEKDFVRVHSIITKGGDSVNVVPDEVVIESYVRASSVEGLKSANEKVNRTISATAAAFGAEVIIDDNAGSEALINDSNLIDLALEIYGRIGGEDCFANERDIWLPSSTDMGDMSTLFPTIHAYACGATGKLHGKDFIIANPERACVCSAKFECLMIQELLKDNAKKAKFIIENYKPVFNSVKEYLEHKKQTNKTINGVIYNENGTITLNYK